MQIISPSRTSFIRYKCVTEEIRFMYKNGDDYTSSNKCHWEVDKFYIITDFEIEDVNISFHNKSLIGITENLKTKNPIEKGVVIQNNDESYLDAYMFGMKLLKSGIYQYEENFFEVNLNNEETEKIKNAINKEKLKNIRLNIFLDELEIIEALNEQEGNEFENFAIRINDFSISC